MMEAVGTSDASVNLHQSTRRNNPGDSHLFMRLRENLTPEILELKINQSQSSDYFD
jgi:hypothetical protein